MRRGLLVIGHGSREAAANTAFEACVAALRQRHPAVRVAAGYLEFARPSLEEAARALAAQCDEVVALPVFLFAAGHVERDIPQALGRVRAEHPAVAFGMAPCLRVHPALVALARTRVDAALPPEANPARTALVVVGRGASEPNARADFCAVVRAVAATQPSFASVQVSFIGLATPPVHTVLESVAGAGFERVVVAPYFLFPGRLLTDLRAQVAAFAARHPMVQAHVADCLGPHPALVDALDSRWAQATAGVRSSVTVTKAAHPANIEHGPLR